MNGGENVAVIEAIKFFWCLIFHRRHRSRTGERRIGQVSITYDIKCSKCGNEDVDIQWVLPV